MRRFVASFLITLVAVVGLGLIAPTADATTTQGRVYVNTQAGFKGSKVMIETISDNRGWCIPVHRSLPGGVGRSVENYRSAWKVKAYSSKNCTTGGFTVKPHTDRTGVQGGKIYVRSIKIVRP